MKIILILLILSLIINVINAIHIHKLASMNLVTKVRLSILRDDIDALAEKLE